MKRVLCFVLLAFSVLNCFGQTSRIDSLKQLYRVAHSAQNKLNYLLQICAQEDTLPEDTLWFYAIQAKKLALELNDGKALSLAALGKANAYLRWENADSAQRIIEPELKKYSYTDPSARSIYFKLAHARIDMMRNKNYKDLFTDVYALLKEAESCNYTLAIAENMNTIGALDYDLDRLDQEKEWLYKALSFTTQNPAFDNVNASICLNLTDYYWWTGKQDSATYYVNKADKYSRRSQNLYLLSVGAQKRALIFLHTSQYKNAEQAINQSLKLIAPVEGSAPQQDKILVLASVYENQKMYDKAISVLNNGLVSDSLYRLRSKHPPDKNANSGFQILFYHQELAKCYKLKGDREKYEAMLEKILEEKDTIYKASSASAIAELETRYQFQKKEAIIARQKLQITRENYLLYGSIMVLLLGAIIFWLIFTAFRRRQKLMALLAVREAEESQRRRISADLHDNLGAQLSFIKRNVEFLINKPKNFQPADELRYLDGLNDFATNAMIDLRETIWLLNKEEVYITDFTDKLRGYLGQQLQAAGHIKWELNDDIGVNWKISSSEVMHLFRIVQELVSNVLRHAQAEQILIYFISPGEQHYKLEVRDNGQGFNTDQQYKGHYGLINIRERAVEINAAVQIISKPGRDTQIILEK
jgi:signal transduction histidine kinase